MAGGYVSNSAFIVWEIQDARGPKHKEAVKERLLTAIDTAKYYAQTDGSQADKSALSGSA